MNRLLHKVKTWVGLAPAQGNGQAEEPVFTIDDDDQVTDTKTALSRLDLLSKSLESQATQLANGDKDDTDV